MGLLSHVSVYNPDSIVLKKIKDFIKVVLCEMKTNTGHMLGAMFVRLV